MLRFNGADPPIVALVENNNHDEANQPDENGTDRNIWEYKDNNHVTKKKSYIRLSVSGNYLNHIHSRKYPGVVPSENSCC